MDALTQSCPPAEGVNGALPGRGCVPDVRLGAAGAGDLVLGEVGVVRRGDEVVGQGPAHVLVDPGLVGVEDVRLVGQHVHGEAALRHELVLLGCRTKSTRRQTRFTPTEPLKTFSFDLTLLDVKYCA